MAEHAGVVVVGSLHFDVMVRAPHLPRTGETLIGEAWWWKPGGKGGNQAMAAARHGAAVAMVGCLGDDLFGTRLRERLAAAGVGLAYVRTVAQGSGMSVAIQEAAGDYAAVVVSGANRDIDAAQVDASSDAIRASRVLLLQNEIDETANVAAARLARDAGASVILNAAPARPMGALAGLVDILVVNAVEAEQLGSAAVADLGGALEAACTLRDLSPGVVVTAGAAGLAAAVDGREWAIPAHPTERVETHGAGDVCIGALAARLSDREELDAALRYANVAATLHVTTPEAGRERIGQADVRAVLADGWTGDRLDAIS